MWGASKEQWEAFRNLVPKDIRPTVNNPTLQTIPDKKGHQEVTGGRFSKFPSRQYEKGVGGMVGWQKLNPTDKELDTWQANENYGFGIVGRTLKGIDIDVDDPITAERIDDAICAFFNADLPYRSRDNSSRKMLLFRFEEEDVNRSTVMLPVVVTGSNERQAIEFKFDRSFIALCGRHKSGALQRWHGLPDKVEDFPSISVKRLPELYRYLQEQFSPTVEEVKDGKVTDVSRSVNQIDVDDPLYQFVISSEWYRGESPEGLVYVKCPYEETHSNYPNGNNTETVFMPKGLGGIKEHGFKCMHESHGGMGQITIQQFIREIGYAPPEFEVVESPAESPDQATRPLFDGMDKAGRFPCNEVNLVLALNWLNTVGVELAYDEFKDEIIYRKRGQEKWSEFKDHHYTEVSLELIRIGMRNVNSDKLRQCIAYVARNNAMDSAKDWVNSLQWDGVERIKDFHINVFGAKDNEYNRSVCEYFFTAMVGRVLDPGCQADMVTVLVGRQGLGKSTFVRTLSPRVEWSIDHALDMRDADASRNLRGKIIVELGELRGIGSRDEESIKAWITRRKDDWVPKFKEFSTSYLRRFILFGSIDRMRFLGDSAGERRWLPIEVCKDGRQFIDSNYVKEFRDQLWAEAREMYKANGIMYKDAETLAKHEHGRYKKLSIVSLRIKHYVTHSDKERFSLEDIAFDCLGLHLKADNRDTAFLDRAMLSIGMTEGEDGLWGFDNLF